MGEGAIKEAEALLSQAGVELRELVNFRHAKGRFTVQVLLDENDKVVNTKFTKTWDLIGPEWAVVWEGGTDQADCQCLLCVRKRALKEERKQEFKTILEEVLEAVRMKTQGLADNYKLQLGV